MEYTFRYGESCLATTATTATSKRKAFRTTVLVLVAQNCSTALDVLLSCNLWRLDSSTTSTINYTNINADEAARLCKTSIPLAFRLTFDWYSLTVW